MKELYRLLNITPNASTTWHPQTDGQTERVNQEIEKYLRIFVNYRQDDWTDWLPLAEFMHNNQVHSATSKSPFMVLYRRNPRLIPNASNYYSISNPAAEEFMTTMSDIHRETCKALQKAATNMKRQYDKKKTSSRDYQAGDKVWLDSTNLHLPRPKKKLDDKRVGPFMIKSKAGAAAYKLKLPPHWKIHLSMRSYSPRTSRRPSLIRKFHLRLLPTSSMTRRNSKLKKSWTLDPARSAADEARNHTKSRTTSSSGKDGRANTTRGSATQRWVMPKKLSKTTKTGMTAPEDLTLSKSWKPLTKKTVTMILDHEYSDNGDCRYNVQ